MSVFYVRTLDPVGKYTLVEAIAMSAGSPPGRPTPGPTPPGGPVDPGFSPPWAQIPVDPGYGIPEGGRPGGPGGPVDPGYSPPWAQVPGGEPLPAGSKAAVVSPVPAGPEGSPVPTPPAGMPAGTVQVMLTIKGQSPAKAWVEPSMSGGPV